MNEKIFAALTELANKLGTTAEYLWGVLVKQAHVSAIINLVWGIICVVVLVCFSRWFLSHIKTWSEDWDSDAIIGAWMGFVAVVIGTVVGAGACLTAAATIFMNPEFWALQKILSSL